MHIEDINAALARRLRIEREARGWSLTDLARHSGVSKAMISRIERAEASPTAALLVRLAAAFDLTLAGFLLRAEPHPGRLSHAVGQPVWTDPETGYVRRQVLAIPDHPIELAEITLPPGRTITLPAASYARIRQAVWVRSGTLTIDEGDERHTLAPGDCLAFGPPAEVTFANQTVARCRYVVALSRS